MYVLERMIERMTPAALLLTFLLLIFPSTGFSKEIALSFDDAPTWSTKQFHTEERTDELIRKLRTLQVPQVAIFANPCKRDDTASVLRQLKKYKNAGHVIANHTCSHPRLDSVGLQKFSADAALADRLLAPLMPAQKFFRFPFLNEGKDPVARDLMRAWLVKNRYRHGMVSVDNDDYQFSSKIAQAVDAQLPVPHDKVKALFVEHLTGAVDFYDSLAMKALGRSPKHVLLLHERDATVLYLDALVSALRDRGWRIIPVEEAYQDEIYKNAPKNTYGNNGIVAQIYFEKTGSTAAFDQFEEISKKLDGILKLPNERSGSAGAE